MNADFLQSLRKSRIEGLRRPEPTQKNRIVVGYIASILGGIIGIGIHLWKSTKNVTKRRYGLFLYWVRQKTRKENFLILRVHLWLLNIFSFQWSSLNIQLHFLRKVQNYSNDFAIIQYHPLRRSDPKTLMAGEPCFKGGYFLL